MDADRIPEKVDTIEVTFLTPDAGWSRLTIRTKNQELSWPLSYVFDPFHEDFVAWLEVVAEHGSATLSIDSEGNISEIRVSELGNEVVRVFGESIYESRSDLLIEMPKRKFV